MGHLPVPRKTFAVGAQRSPRRPDGGSEEGSLGRGSSRWGGAAVPCFACPAPALLGPSQHPGNADCSTGKCFPHSDEQSCTRNHGVLRSRPVEHMGLQAAGLLQRTGGLLHSERCPRGSRGHSLPSGLVPFLTSSLVAFLGAFARHWSCFVCSVESGSRRPCLCFPVRGRGRGREPLHNTALVGFPELWPRAQPGEPASACCCRSLHLSSADRAAAPGTAQGCRCVPQAPGLLVGGSAPSPPSLSPLTPGAAEVRRVDGRLPRQPWALCVSGARRVFPTVLCLWLPLCWCHGNLLGNT